MKKEIKKLIEDILISSVAVVIWAGIIFGIVHFFPSASWLWYIFVVYACITYLGAVTDFTLYKAVVWLTKSKE